MEVTKTLSLHCNKVNVSKLKYDLNWLMSLWITNISDTNLILTDKPDIYQFTRTSMQSLFPCIYHIASNTRAIRNQDGDGLTAFNIILKLWWFHSIGIKGIKCEHVLLKSREQINKTLSFLCLRIKAP